MVAPGVAVAVAAAACFETGYVLQALDARAVPVGGPAAAALGPLVRRRRWLAGLALTGVGALLQVAALRLAPLTVVQPTLALGVVGLVLVGGPVLGEPVEARDLLAAAAIAAGVTALGLAAGDLRAGASHPTAAAVVVLVLAVTVLGAVALRRAPTAVLVAGAGAGDALAALAAERLAHGWAAAAWIAALAWAVVAGLAVAASLSVEMTALRRWPATRVGPIVLVCQLVLPVLAAPLVAGERWGADTPVILGGLTAVAVGAAWLARSAGRGELA